VARGRVDCLEVCLGPMHHLRKMHLSWNRAAIINGLVSSGQNVLVTGAGGGVAVIAIQLCIAKGANVYVTSGSDEKIKKAVELGARGGVNYKSSKCQFAFSTCIYRPILLHKDKWPTELANLLIQDTNGKGKIDVVIDSGGGDQLMTQVGKVLKTGGRVVCYGM
jgi:NADPH:quinone reductase-like Zn-dependent oxidoreductase